MEEKYTFSGLLPAIRRYFYIILFCWTAIIIAMAVWDQRQVRGFTFQSAKNEAIANLNKDIAFREWAAMHGGVYVLVDEKTPPNPYLAGIPDRDLETASGKKLTLMNPAYMARQLNEYFSRTGRIFGHITSLKQKNPVTKPDKWEEAALKAFDKGEKEKLEMVEMDGKPHLRLMQPIMTKQGCLKCHDTQGYKVGDVRGGVSVSVPMDYYYSEERKELYLHIGVYSSLWILGALGLAVNYRYLSRAAGEVVEAEEKLVRTNKELEQFAYVASHDLQEPLRTVTSYLQILSLSYAGKLGKDADLCINFAVDGAKRMQELIHDVLAYSRLTGKSGPMSKVDPGECVTSAMEALNQKISERGAQIKYSAMPSVMGDKDQLTDIFHNLLDNAIKFTSAQSVPEIRITTRTGNGMCVFSVADNGIGIEPRYFDRIFKMFQRLHTGREYPGTGVGLAICKKIVENHGGKIWLESTPGQGTHIHFTIPLAL
ncbi:MAG: DUF3365 domain-containing protein [Nitrospinae bacterium]|nr:DUF3365 domain-containing protein [Nitrospinota bacterium]